MFRGQRSRNSHLPGPVAPARTRGVSGRFTRSVTALSVILLASSLALAGCGGSESSGAGASAGDAAREPAGTGAAAAGAAGADSEADKAAGSGAESDSARESGAGKNGGASKGSGSASATGVHVIRTASLTVRVKDVPEAIDKARSAAEDAGGIVGDESTDRDSGGHERSRLVLRVPQQRYQEVLDALAGTGKLVTRTVKAEDVTDQVVDVDSRIKSQRASVARVRELMDQATSLSDVVSLEGELSNREAELESLLAQQASLKDRTELATITLSLTENVASKPARPTRDDDPTFLDALVGGWHSLVTVLSWLAVALGAVLPFAVPLALLLLLWVRLVRPRLPVRRPRLAGPGLPLSGATPGTQPPAGNPQPAPPTHQPGGQGTPRANPGGTAGSPQQKGNGGSATP